MKQFYQYLHGEIREVSAYAPCPHCGKPDWCYSLGDEISVCKRGKEPASGWKKLPKSDRENSPYYIKEQKKEIREASREEWEYKDRNGKPLVRVVRVTPGKLKKDGSRKDKDIYQQHWNGKAWINGLKGINREDIPIYRYKEVREAIAKGTPIVIVEGETCADALWGLDIPATTNIGGCKKWQHSDSKDLKEADIIIAPDRDKPGINHALGIAESFPDAQWLYLPPSRFFWQSKYLPDSQGLDVADYIKDYKPSKSDILDFIIKDSPNKLNKNLVEQYQKTTEKNDKPTLENELKSTIEVEQPVTLKAQDVLFTNEKYIAIDDKLYKWKTTHYELCNQSYEKRRITEWCKSTPVHISGDRYQYKYAKSTVIEEIWKWILLDLGVNKELVNPPGINCLNGVLKIEYLGKTAIPKLSPHSPDEFYLYCCPIEYDPEAPEKDCDNLLQALDETYRTIFLRTMAASLNLGLVRSHLGRGVKALLCQGTGSNGKDSIREAVSVLFGKNMSNASVTDFRQYDQGRKFSISKLEGSRINWASENSSFANIDGLQGLKLAITGEAIDIEPKNQPEYQYNPQAVFLFNVNDPPLLSGGMDAIKDRYAILKFNKTFKTKPNLEMGELQADSRFRYDPLFLRERICPALLNKIMAQLTPLLNEGIDYSSCQADMEKWQQETNHLWQFAQEMGMKYSPGSKVYVKDLWAELKNWYVENDMLWIGEDDRTGKKILQFGEPSRKGDFIVKASNQLYNRFSKLFPKMQKGQESGNHPKAKLRYFLNISFDNEDIALRNGTRAIQHEILREREENKNKITETRAKLFVESLDLKEREIFYREMSKHRSDRSHSDSVSDRSVPIPVPTECPMDSNSVPTVQNNYENENDSTSCTQNQPAFTFNLIQQEQSLNFESNDISASENTSTINNTKEPKRRITRVKLNTGKYAQVLQYEGDDLTVRIEGTEDIIKEKLENCYSVETELIKPEQLKLC